MDLSILIPARNEMFLARTIEDILANMRADTEVIAVCDGAWPDPPVRDHPKVTLIYHSRAIGQRAATNLAARFSTAKYIMKCDAHCAFDEGFDIKLMADCEPDWTVIPRMYNLHAFDWKCNACGNRTYQGPVPQSCDKCGASEGFERGMVWEPRKSRVSDFWRFDSDLKFQYWRGYGKRPEAAGDIADTMSSIGACFFMERRRYWELDGLDEAHGSWGQVGTEVACKSWLSGGRHVVNKKTWFAHMFRTQKDFSFPYPLTGKDVQKARRHSRKLWLGNTWPKAKHDLQWLVDKFAPVPDWHDAKKPAQSVKRNGASKSLVYYTHSRCEETILRACRKQLENCMADYGYPIISVSQIPIDFGDENIVLKLTPGHLSMFKQVLAGIEACKTDYIFLLEHDLLYHPAHFNFTPPSKDYFYYDRNRWAVDPDTGKAVFYLTNLPSMLCASRELLLRHYRKRVEYVKKHGFKSSLGYSPPKGLPKDQRIGRYKVYMGDRPSLDIRHRLTWTRKRMDKSQFRSIRSRREWTEAYEVPGWGKLKNFDHILRAVYN